VAHPNEVLVREAYAAFGSGDMDTLRNQYFTEDIRWHLTGRNLLTGDYVGMAQILELFGRVFELSGGTYSGEPHDVLANDELAVVLVTQRAEGAGKHTGRTTPSRSSISVTASGPRPGSIQLTNMPWMSSGRNRHDASHRRRAETTTSWRRRISWRGKSAFQVFRIIDKFSMRRGTFTRSVTGRAFLAKET
jgi:uncharacterized protein